MRTRIGVMGSASAPGKNAGESIATKAEELATAIAKTDCVLFSGATTGVVYLVGKTAHDAGVFHIGISPAEDESEHVGRFKLPTDACDAIVYTGFGLKGRNVVLVRSCDIVLFIAGAMGSLNEFTIAHDEGKIIGCLTGTGGVADESEYLLTKFAKKTKAKVFQSAKPDELITLCTKALAETTRA